MITDELISKKAIWDEAHKLAGPMTGDGWDNWGVYALIERQPTIKAVPVDPLAVWLAGYHVSPPEYALKETGALDPIDQASTVFTQNQIATAWAYHLRKLMESGLMGCG